MVVGKKIRVDGKRVLSGWLISYFAIIQSSPYRNL